MGSHPFSLTLAVLQELGFPSIPKQSVRLSEFATETRNFHQYHAVRREVRIEQTGQRVEVCQIFSDIAWAPTISWYSARIIRRLPGKRTERSLLRSVMPDLPRHRLQILKKRELAYVLNGRSRVIRDES
jgi:hypothetical protein